MLRHTLAGVWLSLGVAAAATILQPFRAVWLSRHERVERSPGGVRVVAGGDSFTWGDKIANSDSTWPPPLEKGLTPAAERIAEYLEARGWIEAAAGILPVAAPNAYGAASVTARNEPFHADRIAAGKVIPCLV